MADEMLVVRVTQRHDFTKRRTVDDVISCVRSPRCHLWFSSPCTAGCSYNAPGGPNWRKGPSTQVKILAHWKIHTLLWNGWKRLAKHAVAVGASLSIEWANDSRLHRLVHVRKFVAAHGMIRRKVSGCVMGLKSVIKATLGQPLCKAWGIWTNNASLALALDGPHVLCQGGHVSIPVEGKNTAHTGVYPDNLAKFIHAALSSTLEQVGQMKDRHAWPIPLANPTDTPVEGPPS